MEIAALGKLILDIVEFIVIPLLALIAGSTFFTSRRDRKERRVVEEELSAEAKELKEEQRRQELYLLAQQEGTKALIREAIVNRHKESVHRGYMDVNQRESLNKLYDAYKGMDGNGLVDTLYGEMSDPDIVTTRHT